MPFSGFGAQRQRIESAVTNLHWGLLSLDPASLRIDAQQRVKRQVTWAVKSWQVPKGSRLSCGLRLPQTRLTLSYYSRPHERALRSSGPPGGKRPDQFPDRAQDPTFS